MKVHIDTIPVWDAIRGDDACFLCSMARRAERTWAERFLGGSVMEPDWRIRVNAQGFCRRHHRLLYGMGNRLGHALMLESHSDEAVRTMRTLLDQAGQAANAMNTGALGRLGRGAAKAGAAYQEAVAGLTRLAEGCILCAHIDADMESYTCSVLHLWKNDSDFRAAMGRCRGFCLPHLRDLLRFAPEMLSPGELPDFVAALTALEDRCFGGVREDVSWFIKKFDYRYREEPWKNAQNAVPRAVNALRGWALPDGPEDGKDPAQA